MTLPVAIAIGVCLFPLQIYLFFVCRGYVEFRKDRKAITEHLDKELGAGAYTLTLEKYRMLNGSSFMVTLRDYPNVPPFEARRLYSDPFLPIIFDWLVGPPYISCNYLDPVADVALKDYLRTYKITYGKEERDSGEYRVETRKSSAGVMVYEIATEQFSDVKKCYTDATRLAGFLERKYPILMRGDSIETPDNYEICVNIHGLHLKDEIPINGKWYTELFVGLCRGTNGEAVMQSWDSILEELTLKATPSDE